MKRAIILLFDSFGIGASLDAVNFGDQGANTLGHIAEWAAAGKADNADRQGALNIPNLTRLGLTAASLASCGQRYPGLNYDSAIEGCFGYAVEQSRGKDTPSGHWEIAGLPVDFDWGYFKPDYPSFPETLTNDLIKTAMLPGILGNRAASGTDIMNELGQIHIETLKPIIYTSADSVLQIAAHEKYFGLTRLYEVCEIARRLVDPYHIGRVIARPFLGDSPKNFERTMNRRDYAIPPHGPTLLSRLIETGGNVISIGKVADVFAHQGISKVIQGKDNLDLFDKTLETLKHAPDRSLIFTNLVDFDSKYGHRRDVAGYAAALEKLDKRLPEFESYLKSGDLAIITADHGCDPTFPGSDHTREHIPVLAFGPDYKAEKFIGRRDSFADIGQSIANHLESPLLDYGVSFLE